MQKISRRAAHRLIVLHPKLNIESDLKWQTCFSTVFGAKEFNSIPDEQLILDGHRAKTSFPF